MLLKYKQLSNFLKKTPTLLLH